jgi:endonuclease/exonuclease/phosphatase family metal-dependent hydrolase
LTRLLGVDVQQLGSQSRFITYDGRSSDISKAQTLDYVFLRSRQAHLAYAATVTRAMDANRLEARLSDHLAVQMDLTLEIVPLTAQSPKLGTGLAGGKQPL